MKREREKEEKAGTTFFNLDECVDILCLPVPSPYLVAKLLQLSKRIRFLVWRFLIEPAKGDYEWVDEFCEELWEHKNMGPFPPVPHDYAGYPLFVSPKIDNDRDSTSTYFIAKKLFGSVGSYLVTKRLATDNESPYDTIIEHEYYPLISRKRIFNWFIVARALSIRLDLIVQAQIKPILHSGGTILRTDNRLFIK